MNKKTKLGAIMLFALVCASPVQAFDWFDSWFGNMTAMGPGSGGGNPGVDPAITAIGVGSGGGDPTVNTTGPGSGGGHPGVDPN